MRRRAFITLLGGAAASSVSWPLTPHAQQGERVRRIAVLTNLPSNDRESMARLAAFLQGLQEWGWSVGRNLRIDYRWGTGHVEGLSQFATELVALAPEVILAVGVSVMGPLLQATRAVPIVFVQVTDPVGAGFVASLARPGGNATGFTLFEFGISAKWLELLKQIAPGVTRVAVLRDPTIVTGIGQLAAMQSVAPALGVELSPIGVHDAREIERAITAFGQGSNGGMVVLPGSQTVIHRALITALAARHRLPAVYAYRFHVADGGLISYGPDSIDQYRRAAAYVDRILKGEKPADLPVQAPTRYELTVNLKTAKALSLDVPPTLLATADEVIE